MTITVWDNSTGWGIFPSQAHTREYLPLFPTPPTAPQSHLKQGIKSCKITVSIARSHSNPVNNDTSGLNQLPASISLVHVEQDKPPPRATWVLVPTDKYDWLYVPRQARLQINAALHESAPRHKQNIKSSIPTRSSSLEMSHQQLSQILMYILELIHCIQCTLRTRWNDNQTRRTWLI